METIKQIYKIGTGPSSSHTMGPRRAAIIFKNKNPKATSYKVELYGSLALTGKGHLTDVVIKNVLGINTEIIFKPEMYYAYHPNGMKLFAYDNNQLIDEWLVFSIGGGDLKELNEERSSFGIDCYKEKNMTEILDYCNKKNISLYDYIIENDEKDIVRFGNEIIDTMFESVERGIKANEILPGNLKLHRKAKDFYQEYLKSPSLSTLAFASSLAVSEENASGGIIVTAPTCGASGVVPGVLYSYYKYFNIDKELLVKGLLVGGLIGNIVKTNGSISGAEVGCQGEVGVACAMASAALTYIKGGTNKQIEYAAEIALEHHLGLTCDPLEGYVQIPCIERNAMSCKRAIDSSQFALLTDGNHYIKFDDAIQTMLETGKDLNKAYRETSIGGLAKIKEHTI